jgi:glycosyltransferase involved in cell wall biosynthesis
VVAPVGLTVIVPVHNEEGNVDMFYERVLPVLRSLPVDSWEILFMNNASTDTTLDKILRLRETDAHVKVITLTRNFGLQASLTAGLTSRESDLYAIVDVDCEDPPELLAQFHREIQAGAHTAYGIRSQRDEPSWLTSFRWLFYRINRSIADFPVILWMAEFAMFTRTVRDAVVANKSAFPFVRTEIAYAGLKAVGIPYFRAQRKHGLSHVNFRGMAEFAVWGFLTSSTLPLRVTLYLSAFMMSLYLILLFSFHMSLAEAADSAVIFGFIYLLATVPVLSLYVARTYKNTLARPVFIIDPEKTKL